MENVAALLASVPHEHPPLIVIDDPAKLIGFDWSVPEGKSKEKARNLPTCLRYIP